MRDFVICSDEHGSNLGDSLDGYACPAARHTWPASTISLSTTYPSYRQQYQTFLSAEGGPNVKDYDKGEAEWRRDGMDRRRLIFASRIASDTLRSANSFFFFDCRKAPLEEFCWVVWRGRGKSETFALHYATPSASQRRTMLSRMSPLG